VKISDLDAAIRRKYGIDRLTRKNIEALQLERLNRMLSSEKRRGGFYNRLPDRLDSMAELSTLPFTTPEDLAKHGGSMLLLSQAEIQRVITGATSGTTGEAKRVFYTEGDCRDTVEFFAAGLSELVKPGSRTLIAMPFSGPHGLGELISDAIASLGAEPLRAGAGLTFGEYALIMNEKRPDTFVGMPVQLLSILRFGGLGFLRRALVSGDACPESVMRGIEDFGLELFPHYGCREMGLGGAVTCPAHEGMHLQGGSTPRRKSVGPDGAPLPPGQEGELVLTTFGMEAMPLIRYRTGDRARLLPGPCPCGSELLRLDGVGRRDDAMERLDDAVFSQPGAVDYSVTVEDGRTEMKVLTAGEFDGERAAEAAAGLGLPAPRAEKRACLARDRALYSGKRTINRK
jgi:phenylacetate-CoA ligase